MKHLQAGTWIAMLWISIHLLGSDGKADDEPFRPKMGQFPPLEKAHTYRGELAFVDHANRRGSLRVQGEGMYFRNAPHPFAMLPYGIIRYQGAPADLRDIPLGTVLHVKAFLPPDPKFSVVPVLPVNNRNKTAGYSGVGIAPAENHVLLLEDEPSHCLRQDKVWKLQEIDIKNNQGMIVARCEHKSAEASETQVETLTFDSATRFWRGRECLTIEDLVAENTWPAEGKHPIDNLEVHLGISWRPTPKGIFTRFHISDIWLDEVAMLRAAQNQNESHKAFIRSRWMPAWIDSVEYKKFGTAKVTATLFGGMDESLYADFKKGTTGWMNAVESTLKHGHGAYGPAHMACRGPILDVTKTEDAVPLGSSGIQITFQTDLIIEGIRPGRIVRVRAGDWPQVNLPREEYLNGDDLEERFPTPDIFPKY